MAPSLNLVTLSGRFCICKFPPTADPPSCIFETDFYSITRTDEELSIVCWETEAISGADDIPCESGWSCLKVQGPLDFAHTGILASLTQSLAEADISIFVISTFDTDYLLVRTEKLGAAVETLQAAGHNVKDSISITKDASSSNRPRDGPATNFEADPLVAYLVQPELVEEETFGLGVIAGWPPQHDMQTYYDTFRSHVQACFDDVDTQHFSCPNVYLYPSSVLHVTVATLHPNTPNIPDPHGHILSAWTNVLHAASELDEWPTQPLQLVIDSAQIGTRAGILLWKETTGGMDAMRRCLRATTNKLRWQLESVGMDDPERFLSIPPIVHSSFLRFRQIPTTPGPVVQQRFQENVVSRLPQLFPDTLEISTCKLICERRPYMHIPHNNDNVFASFTLD